MGIGGLGMMEIIMIFLVILLLFGAKRLPEIGSSLGKGIREFKSSVREIEGELKAPLVDDKKKVPSPGSVDAEAGPRRLATTDEEVQGPQRLTTSEEDG